MPTFQPLEAVLTASVRAAVASLAPDAPLDRVAVERSKDGRGSDFQTAAAMQLSKALRKNPRQIAQDIVDALDVSDLADVDIAGPGFIGFTVHEGALGRTLQAQMASPTLGAQPGDGSTIVIDFSSPNVAKRMHIGHIRSTIIGDAIRRLGTFLGHRVVADNHIGDWGTQFGQLIHAWNHWRDDAAYAAQPVEELERLYVKFHADAAEDPSLHDRSREELAKLQAGDPVNHALWQQFIDASRSEFDSIYDRLGVSFDVTYGESHYNDALQPLIAELLQTGIAVEDQGAAVVYFKDEAGEDVMTPFLIRKKDGAALYATTDIATVRFRMAEWSPSRIIYVTDMRQQLHFQQLFATVRIMGITDVQLDHFWFGMMSLPEGAMSTRKGNVIRLEELLDESEARARAVLDERLGDDPSWSDAERAELATILGLGAVKYADLSNNPQTNITFSFDKMLSFEGNTAPYLQYTSARTWSLARRAQEEGLEPDGATFRADDPAERDLALHLFAFGRAVEGAWEQGKPSILATFLFELAQRYHRWYAACPVLKGDDAALKLSRLNLNAASQRVLSEGLALLGIRVPQRM
jgi:arginyl-tRNA synthetase